MQVRRRLYEALQETAHLLRSPANARRILRSYQQALSFTPTGWDDYVHWQTADRQALKRVNRLIDDTLRDPYAGIGLPEPLKRALAEAGSRRIQIAWHCSHPFRAAVGGKRRSGFELGVWGPRPQTSYLRFLTSSVSCGTTWWRSPTTP
ncbi:Txe/YoeB family addiction module toxin [Nonomuraea sp. SYSU D8015]|uniref:Txe/YoeB family addiction module toxin n=1 Tax=Nonomuraea sp. SYSU D8015 TaxID=2593644 RepID=UPI003FA57882